ncbi:hypothetical protein Pelo_15944 [Pelomyxa schiedti]|nr:hypothetical protein Pelo_15944 [Pelomyxa schiedti]
MSYRRKRGGVVSDSDGEDERPKLPDTDSRRKIRKISLERLQKGMSVKEVRGKVGKKQADTVLKHIPAEGDENGQCVYYGAVMLFKNVLKFAMKLAMATGNLYSYGLPFVAAVVYADGRRLIASDHNLTMGVSIRSIKGKESLYDFHTIAMYDLYGKEQYGHFKVMESQCVWYDGIVWASQQSVHVPGCAEPLPLKVFIVGDWATLLSLVNNAHAPGYPGPERICIKCQFSGIDMLGRWRRRPWQNWPSDLTWDHEDKAFGVQPSTTHYDIQHAAVAILVNHCQYLSNPIFTLPIRTDKMTEKYISWTERFEEIYCSYASGGTGGGRQTFWACDLPRFFSAGVAEIMNTFSHPYYKEIGMMQMAFQMKNGRKMKMSFKEAVRRIFEADEFTYNWRCKSKVTERDIRLHTMHRDRLIAIMNHFEWHMPQVLHYWQNHIVEEGLACSPKLTRQDQGESSHQISNRVVKGVKKDIADGEATQPEWAETQPLRQYQISVVRASPLWDSSLDWGEGECDDAEEAEEDEHEQD